MSDGQVNRDCEEPSHKLAGRKQSLCPVRQMEEMVGLNIGSLAPVSRSLASLERTQSTGKQPRLFTFPWRRRSTASHLNQQALRIGQAQARWLRLLKIDFQTFVNEGNFAKEIPVRQVLGALRIGYVKCCQT